jgi:hypothetical protein
MTYFTLNAADLTAWQRCRREYVLRTEWQTRRWKPKALLAYCLRKAIVAVSAGVDPAVAARDATLLLVQHAADDGLDMPPGSDTYRLGQDLCAVIEVVTRCLAKLVLLELRNAPDLEIDDGIIWQTSAWADESGVLHRWAFVDRLDWDTRVRELHSWFVAGDLMLSRTPMTLHFLRVGRLHEERWRSPWTTAWILPALRNGNFHFRSPQGRELRGEGWKAIYLSEDKDLDPNEWADRCFDEGQSRTLMEHASVTVPTDDECAAVTLDIRKEAKEMRRVVGCDWQDFAMQRPACDRIGGPCAFQTACYAAGPVDLSSSRLFRPRVDTKVFAALKGA